MLKVALIFLSKILLSLCGDYLAKELKKLFPSAMLSYVNQLGIVKNTLEVQEALAYGSCFSKHLSHVLKISACLYINQQIMHLVCFFCFLIKL